MTVNQKIWMVTISFMIAASNMLFSAGGIVYASYPNFTDTNNMSDEDFFGKWNPSNGSWEKEGKINYFFSPALSEVENFVKQGDYPAASEELLLYYKNRDNIQRSASYGSGNSRLALLTKKQIFNFSEDYINTVIIDTTAYSRYEIDLGTVTANGTFMLAAADKSGDIAEISSKEGSSGCKSMLRLKKKDGTVIDLPVERDSYIRAYDNAVSYENENYGAQTSLLVKDSSFVMDDSRYSPVGANTRRTYIRFNDDAIAAALPIQSASLIIYARLIPETDAPSLTQTQKEIMVFNSYNKVWRETSSDIASGPVLTWGNISHNHFSWNGLPGGFDWLKPKGASSEYINYNTRFYQVNALINEYLKGQSDENMYYAIEHVLDFIKDGGAGIPLGRDIEPANRGLVLPPAFFCFADSPLFNGAASTAMLKYLYQESMFLESGAYYMTDNNRGIWHTAGFNRIISYFPEFARKSVWEGVIQQRLSALLDTLIKEDGCYNEATYGYPPGIVDWMCTVIEDYQNTNRQVPRELYEKVRLLERYLMYSSYPDATMPDWGEGSASNMCAHFLKIGNFAQDEELKYWGSGGKTGTAPKNLYARFENLKVVTSRTDWTENATMFWMNAKNGSNHNHKDSLSLTFFSAGREILSDTGMTSYDSKHPHFQWQRHQTRSHNTIEIDGLPQRGTNTLDPDQNGESDIAIYHNGLYDKVEGWTDATQGFRHSRGVTFVRPLHFLIVSDRVRPEDDLVHTYTQNWHSRPYSGAAIDEGTKTGRTNFAAGTNILIAQSNPQKLTASLENGFDSYPADTKYFCYTQKTAGDVVYNTVLFPREQDAGKEITTASIELDVPDLVASAMRINIYENSAPTSQVVYYNSLAEQAVQRNFDTWSTDAKTAVIERDNSGGVKSAAMFQGRRLMESGEALLESDELLSDLSFSQSSGVFHVYSSDEGIGEATLKINAPAKVLEVRVNGVLVEYVVMNNKIYIFPEGKVITKKGGLIWSEDFENTVPGSAWVSTYANGSANGGTNMDSLARIGQNADGNFLKLYAKGAGRFHTAPFGPEISGDAMVECDIKFDVATPNINSAAIASMGLVVKATDEGAINSEDGTNNISGITGIFINMIRINTDTHVYAPANSGYPVWKDVIGLGYATSSAEMTNSNFYIPKLSNRSTGAFATPFGFQSVRLTLAGGRVSNEIDMPNKNDFVSINLSDLENREGNGPVAVNESGRLAFIARDADFSVDNIKVYGVKKIYAPQITVGANNVIKLGEASDISIFIHDGAADDYDYVYDESRMRIENGKVTALKYGAHRFGVSVYDRAENIKYSGVASFIATPDGEKDGAYVLSAELTDAFGCPVDVKNAWYSPMKARMEVYNAAEEIPVTGYAAMYDEENRLISIVSAQGSIPGGMAEPVEMVLEMPPFAQGAGGSKIKAFVVQMENIRPLGKPMMWEGNYIVCDTFTDLKTSAAESEILAVAGTRVGTAGNDNAITVVSDGADQRALRFYKGANSSDCFIKKTLSPGVSGKVYIGIRLKRIGEQSPLMAVLGDGGQRLFKIEFSPESMTITAGTTTSTVGVAGSGYQSEGWNDLLIEIDTAKDKMSVNLNGKNVMEKENFEMTNAVPRTTDAISAVWYGNTKEQTRALELYVDYLKVWKD